MKRIQILGTGCAKCDQLKNNAEAAIKQLGIEAEVEKVEDMNKITEFGVMMTPALAVDGEVKIVGRVPAPEKLARLLA